MRYSVSKFQLINCQCSNDATITTICILENRNHHPYGYTNNTHILLINSAYIYLLNYYNYHTVGAKKINKNYNAVMYIQHISNY